MSEPLLRRSSDGSVEVLSTSEPWGVAEQRLLDSYAARLKAMREHDCPRRIPGCDGSQCVQIDEYERLTGDTTTFKKEYV